MKTCPYCAEEIQDAAIKCRYCGSDLTIAPGNTPDRVSQPTRVAALTQEKEYYNDGQTLVTSRRAVLNGVTYAMSNITSVALVTHHKEKIGFLISLMLVFGVAIVVISSAQNRPFAIILGVLMVFGAFILITKPGPYDIVRIHSGSGETDALQGRERQSLQPIVDAIKQAIVERQ